jgi:hypothetical protein
VRRHPGVRRYGMHLMSAYPALDFLRKVQVWQDDRTGTAAGLAVALPDGDQTTLSALLDQVQHTGPTTMLESQARFWLVGYQQMSPPLTQAQAAELAAILTETGARPVPDIRNVRHRPARLILLAVLLICLLGAGLSTAALVTGTGNSSPPAAGAPARPPAGPQQGPLTDLQQFRADWSVPAAASPDSGRPGQLVLLADGLYYPSPWTIPAGDPGWVADTSETVTGTPAVHGDLADITDSDGTVWTVAVGQPFVLAANPQVVLRVLRDATVQSMPQPHAITVRKHLSTGR